MALKWFDGFDYLDTASLALIYESVGDSGRYTTASSALRYGTQGFRVSASSGGSAGNGWIRKTIGGTETVMIMGVALQPVTCNTATIQLLGFYEGTTLHTDLRMSTGTSTYDLLVTRNGTQLGSTATAALVDETWHYVEMKVTIHDSTGTIDVWVNGTSVISGTGLDTRNGGTGYCDRVLLGNAAGSGNNHTVYYDDWYVLDSTGSLNNAKLGDSRVAALYPSGAGTTTQMTASAGSNYQCVDEPSTPNGDTDYVAEATTGELDLYAMGDLPTTAGTVAGIKEIMYHRKDDAGTRNLRQLVRTGGTNYDTADVSVSDTYKYATNIRETNPNTSAAWDQTAIDGLEAGQKLQS